MRFEACPVTCNFGCAKKCELCIFKMSLMLLSEAFWPANNDSERTYGKSYRNLTKKPCLRMCS